MTAAQLILRLITTVYLLIGCKFVACVAEINPDRSLPIGAYGLHVLVCDQPIRLSVCTLRCHIPIEDADRQRTICGEGKGCASACMWVFACWTLFQMLPDAC